MDRYNLEAQEIAKLIELYSKIKSPETRIFAQGYLNGLADMSSVRNPQDPVPKFV